VIKQIKLAIHPRTIKNKFLHLALKGNNVECVCCGSKYISFLPAGIVKRPNAKCIKCGSLERHRSLWMFLKEKDLLAKPIRLLHIAPEKIFYNHFISLSQIEYYPVDLMPDKYAYGIKTIKMDVTNLNYPENYFDAVICNHVLEHIRDDNKAMTEMCRVLKPHGWAILNTPVALDKALTAEDLDIDDPQKQLELFGQPDHVRIYGRDFTTRLERAGFKTNFIDYVSTFSSSDQFRYGLQKDEPIIYCTC
jgi:SAM-dependent methyltransferase